MIRKVFSSNNLNPTLSPTTSTNLTTRTPQSIPTSATSVSLKQSSPPVPVNPKKSKKEKKLTSIFKRISLEWQYILYRLRSISEEVFETDEYIDDLFETSDGEESIDRLMRSNKGYNSTEEQFLKEFKKYKSLDNMAQVYQAQVTNRPRVQSTLQDIIRQQSQQQQHERDLGEEDDEEDDTEYDISYHDLDIYQLRKEFEQIVASSSEGDADTISSQTNIGTTLWEYRRNKWLTPTNNSNQVYSRLQANSIEHIPRDNLVKVYNNLIDKNRPLKDNKRINLFDLIKIINLGWIAEEKWARAGRGLP
ncbi:hypothetical protein JA1_000782 [Spathaspora sp. JA1]|nr:hypothetical protein JA1_000782 [Spathaspora sp. JA1]